MLRRVLRALLVALVIGVLGCSAHGQEAVRPNVVVIMADDMDLRAARRIPEIQSLIAAEGVTIRRYFVTDPLCCPSRATYLRGQYVHNLLESAYEAGAKTAGWDIDEFRAAPVLSDLQA